MKKHVGARAEPLQGLLGNRAHAGLRGRDRARGAHLPLRAVQHPVGLDEADAAGRRLPVRVQVRLRLQQALAAVQPAAVRGPDRRRSCRSAATSRCSSCRPTIAPTTSSASSACPATSCRSTDGVLYVNGEPASRVRLEDFYDDDGTEQRRAGALPRDAAAAARSYTVLDMMAHGSLDDTRVYEVPAGPRLRDGRQSRQLARQPGRQRRLHPDREPDRAGRDHLLLDQRPAPGCGRSGTGPPRSASAGCSG